MSAVNPPIGQALADDDAHGLVEAHGVGDPQRRALVVTEVELADVALQVLRRDVVVSAELKLDRMVPFL